MRKSYLKKAANCFAGRVLRRLLGEEKGVVMMEYIIVGLLIAAACVIAVAFFGHNITGMFGSLGSSVQGNPQAADEQQQKMQRNQDDNVKNSQAYNTGKHSDKNQAGDQAFSNK